MRTNEKNVGNPLEKLKKKEYYVVIVTMDAWVKIMAGEETAGPERAPKGMMT